MLEDVLPSRRVDKGQFIRSYTDDLPVSRMEVVRPVDFPAVDGPEEIRPSSGCGELGAGEAR